ncbi:5'-nucleotidase domain-containing protein 1-like, partial [Oculina patagonica]
FWPDVLFSARKAFNPSSFGAQHGYFFHTLENNISTFVKPCSKKITNWIKSLKGGKQQVFLLTNSFIDYTNLLMNYAVGKDWPELFNIIVCMAGKPGFFKSEEPPTQFHEIDGEKEICTVQELKENKIYSRGNHKEFTAFLQKQTNQDNPKVLYFGDSIKSDLYPSAVFGDWHVVTVLEEMESEGMVTCENEENSVEDGPSSKKARLMIHEIEIEKNKEEVLLSKQWGSFFVHHKDTQNGFIHNVLDGNYAGGKETGRREMNTFWGDLIQKYSTIAIPRIDFITELQLDYTFKPFSDSKGGFFPGSPKSLH